MQRAVNNYKRTILLLVMKLQTVDENFDQMTIHSMSDKFSLDIVERYASTLSTPCKFVRLGVRFWLCGDAGSSKVSLSNLT